MKDYTGLRAEAKINDVILIDNSKDLETYYGIKMILMHVVDKKDNCLIGNYYDKKIDNSIVRAENSGGSIDEKSNYMVCRRDVKDENDILNCPLLTGISVNKRISRGE
jgi:hypothetical protein